MTELSTNRPNLKLWQWRIVVMGWLTYASYYLGRVNLSIAIPDLRENLNLSSQEVGLFSSGFFLAYAFGQLISGHLGDRISPRKLVFAGMFLSVAMNLLFGSVGLWTLMLVVWTINGFFQSTGWAPILKVLANWHSPEQRRKVAGIYATSYVAGNALSWILAGWLVASLSWRAAFWVPGALMGLVALAWYLLIRDTPQGAGFTNSMRFAEEADKTGLKENSQSNMLHVLRRFWPLVLAAVSGGMILFALIIWAPTYFVDMHGLGIGKAATISIFFPIAGTIGTLAVSWLVSGPLCCKEIFLGAAIFIVVAGLLFLFPVVSTSLLMSATLLILVGSILYGVNTIITTILPMVLSERQEVSMVAGLIDFAFNIGASLGGFLVGAIIDRFSWSAVFIVLAIGAILTSVLLVGFAFWINKLSGRSILSLEQSIL
jgi:OPA family glycerol-3-phosphate transporter-like MFS transporter